MRILILSLGLLFGVACGSSEADYLPMGYSRAQLNNIAVLRASLPNFMAPPSTILASSLDLSLLTQFPQISPGVMADFLTTVWQKVNVAVAGPYSHRDLPELTSCSCDQAYFSDRILTILTEVNLWLQKVPSSQRDQKLVHTAFGEDTYLQTYLLALLFSKAGFQNVYFYGIGPYTVPWNNHQAAYKQYFGNLPGIHPPEHFRTVADYLQAIREKKAFPSHSFDAIDAGPYHSVTDSAAGILTGSFAAKIWGYPIGVPGGFPVDGFDQNQIRRYFLVAITPSLQGEGQVSCAGAANPIEAGLRVGYRARGGPPMLMAPDADRMVFSQPLVTDFCTGLQGHLAGKKTSEWESTVRNYADGWLRAHGSQFARFSPYAADGTSGGAWSEFAVLINHATAPRVNPMIAVLQNPQGFVLPSFDGPVTYTGYFPALGGIGFTVPEPDRYFYFGH